MKRLIFGLITVVLVASLLAGCGGGGGGGGKSAVKSSALPDSLSVLLEDAYYIQQTSDEYLTQAGKTVPFTTDGVAERTYGPWYLKDGWYEGTAKEGAIEETVKIKEDGTQIEIVGSNYSFQYELSPNEDNSLTGLFKGTSADTAFEITLTNWNADAYGSGTYGYLEEDLVAVFDEATPAMTINDVANCEPALSYRVLDRFANAYFLESAFYSYFEQAENEAVPVSVRIKSLSPKAAIPENWVWSASGYWIKGIGDDIVKVIYIPSTKETTINVDGSDTEGSYLKIYTLTENAGKVSGTILQESESNDDPPIHGVTQIDLTDCDPAQYGSGQYVFSVGPDSENLGQVLDLTATYARPYMKLEGWVGDINATFNVVDATPYSGN